MSKTVVIVAALDTKGEEAKLIRDYVAARGTKPLVVDVGVLGEPTIPSDVARGEVAAAGGAPLEDAFVSVVGEADGER